MAPTKDNSPAEEKHDHIAENGEAAPHSRLFPSARITVTIMMLLACLITYILRLNMGFAMVCMIKSSPKAHHYTPLVNYTNGTNFDEMQKKPIDKCVADSDHHNYNSTHEEEGEFEWEKSLQGYLLGSFFYGYIITQVPSGWLADRFGGKRVLAIGLGTVSVLTLLLPEAARLNPYAMLAVRVLQGMFGAVSFPGIHSVVGNWAPPTEVGLLMAIAYSGMYGGTLLTFPICGLLCKYGFAGGWPSVFYVTGIMGLVYVFSMFFLVYDGYEKHPRISQSERRYLEKNLIGHHESGSGVSVPWKELLRSTPVWAITISHFCANFGLYFLVINLPLFMKEVLKFDIKQNGLLSSLPYICSLLVNLFAGKLTDYLRRQGKLTLTIIRRIFNTIGLILPAICMLSITFMDCTQRYMVVAAIVAVQGLSGFAYSGGFFYNHVDLSPRHAGILMGFTNMFGTIPGIVAPLLVGLLTPKGTQEEWNVLFYIGTTIYVVGAIVYAMFASGERQPWSFTEEELKEQMELKKKFVESNAENSENVKASV
ncbi:hypothetical protein CHUAL_009906 [Chamberlinius hualienensis]